MNKDACMKLKKFKLKDLKEHPKNYNTHPKAQIEELKESLTEYEQFKNIVVWNGFVIAGNGLVMAARELGWEDIQAVDVSGIPEEKAVGILIADNAAPFGGVPDLNKLDELLDITGLDIPGVSDDWLKDIGVDFDDGLSVEPTEHDGHSEAFEIIVICDDEKHQIALLNKFEKEGVNCRAICG